MNGFDGEAHEVLVVFHCRCRRWFHEIIVVVRVLKTFRRRRRASAISSNFICVLSPGSRLRERKTMPWDHHSLHPRRNRLPTRPHRPPRRSSLRLFLPSFLFPLFFPPRAKTLSSAHTRGGGSLHFSNSRVRVSRVGASARETVKPHHHHRRRRRRHCHRVVRVLAAMMMTTVFSTTLFGTFEGGGRRRRPSICRGEKEYRVHFTKKTWANSHFLGFRV